MNGQIVKAIFNDVTVKPCSGRAAILNHPPRNRLNMTDTPPPSGTPNLVSKTESQGAQHIPGEQARRLAPILIGLAYLAFWQIAPRIPTGSIGAVIVSTVIALVLAIWLPARFGYNLRRSPAWAVANAVVAAAVIVPLQVMVVTRHRIILPWELIGYIPGLPFLALIWLAASLGVLLSFLVRGANMIPPIAAVLALVDIWTVLLGGPVQKIMQSENPTARAVTQVMTVPLPAPRQRTGAAPINGSVGFADFLFIAFFVASIGRFVPSRSAYLRTLYGLIVVLSVYMLAVLFLGLNLPALVPMAVTMLALHWRHFHYERSELYALLYASLFIALIAAGFWYFGRQREPAAEGAGASALGMSAPVARISA